MNPPPLFSAEQIDGLVRATLAVDEQTVDVAALEARIARQLADNRSQPAPRRWRRMLPLGAAVAACLTLLATVGGHLLLSPRSASAYSLVSSASSALARSADRCYRVDEFVVPDAWAKGLPFLQVNQGLTVWSRGDRFLVNSVLGDRTLTWGQDERERLWGAINEQYGVSYESAELPAPFREAISYLNLDIRKITAEILTDYDLRREPGDEGLIVIRATVKRKPRQYHHFTSVQLEIEEGAKIIRRMVMIRTSRKVEIARIAFTLIDERPLLDDEYRLAGHLADDADIVDADRPGLRQRLIRGLSPPKPTSATTSPPAPSHTPEKRS